jgi:hypothetical protein
MLTVLGELPDLRELIHLANQILLDRVHSYVLLLTLPRFQQIRLLVERADVEADVIYRF